MLFEQTIPDDYFIDLSLCRQKKTHSI